MSLLGYLPPTSYIGPLKDRIRRSKSQLRRYHQRRTAVLDAYGGICAVCGGTDQIRILQREGQDEYRYGVPLYTYLIREGFPDIIDLICKECHLKTLRGKRGRKIITTYPDDD